MNAVRRLLIFPYNGNGIEALQCIGADYQFLGFVDDDPKKIGTSPNGYPIWGREAFNNCSDACVLAVPGSPVSYSYRKEIITGLGITQDRFARVIHPSAIISPFASIGYNLLVMPGVVITSNARIGSHICILPNTVIHHDVVIGDWSLVGSCVSIAGGVNIENNCYIGSGSNIKNDIRIQSGALVGLGSNVLKDVSAGAIVVGNPAKNF